MKKIIFLGLTLISFQTFALGQKIPGHTPNQEPIPKFYEVVPHKISRSAQPTEAGFKKLQALGFKTILDLRDEDPAQITREGEIVQSLGMNFISVPLDGFFAPAEKDMNQIQNILNDETLQPILIHCKHGEDRTGLSIGLYRVFTQKVAVKAAKKEMLQLGFHKALLGLNHYFDTHAKN